MSTHIRHWGLYTRLNVHVLDSKLAVVRALWRKFNKTGKSRKCRKERHTLIREILAHHKREGDYFKLMRF